MPLITEIQNLWMITKYVRNNVEKSFTGHLNTLLVFKYPSESNIFVHM